VTSQRYGRVQHTALSYTHSWSHPPAGKVTDGHDRNTLMTILKTYYTADIHDPQYKFSPSGIYYAPPQSDYKGYLEYINALPLIAQPEVFGMHENADITKDLQETTLLLESVMLTMSRDSAAGGLTFEETLGAVAHDILERLPQDFDLEAVSERYPQDYYNSMNTVLVQELGRFNNLLTCIRSSLINLGKAVKGLALMSAQLEQVGRALFDGKVPAMWRKASFPTLKPLGAYMKEVLERIAFFQTWIDRGSPLVYWISGFFFTQAFLTASKQNYARKVKIPIDLIDFDFEVKDVEGDCVEAPTDGVYCRGLFLEGARWNYDTHVLDESEPKVLFSPMPVMWMVPMEISKFHAFNNYLCPMYKTTERRGILSTTGHSTNFVLDVRVPSAHDGAHWTKRGVAFTQTLDM
jgi:dynein heavy chain